MVLKRMGNLRCLLFRLGKFGQKCIFDQGLGMFGHVIKFWSANNLQL